ncbi:MAG: hypothetical protein GF364_02290 [Candidatus Lokiarchaeota archaeon]|nr:hypothetical protein [Candidatus Lokiarchaeota archaeon]
MKIVVAGPFQSGKSKYIQALDERAINIMTLDKNKKECTIGMDIGSYICEGMKISIFGTPGLLRFKTIRQIIISGADGILFMFDGTNPDKDDAAIQILNEIRNRIPRRVPIVYMVNKIGEPNCRSVDVVKAQNYLPKSAEVFGINVEKGENVIEPLDELVYLIRESMKPLVVTLRKYQNNPLGLKVALNRSVDEIMELLNAMELRGIISIDRTNMTYEMKQTADFFV